jgi:uncharacterized protein (TIRG00374 family)
MKFSWKAALGFVLTAICLYWAFHQTKWAEAIEQARHANYWLLALGAIAATGLFPLRAIRWRIILDPVVPKAPLSPLWRSIAIGMMVNNIALLRAGEIARVFAVTRLYPAVTFPIGFASLVVDRVFDAIVVLLLLALGVVAGHFPVSTQIGGYPMSRIAIGFAAVPIVMLIGLYWLVFSPDTLIRIFEMFARRVSTSVEQKGGAILRRFAEGLSVLRSPVHFFGVFSWTLLHWLLQPVAFWLSLKAFGIDVPWSATLLLQGIIVILVALPGAPGFFGQFELGAQVALGVYGVDATKSLAWALVFHVASFIPITLIGAFYATRLGFTMSDIKNVPAEA